MAKIGTRDLVENRDENRNLFKEFKIKLYFLREQNIILSLY